MNLYEQTIISPLPNHRYILLERFEYRDVIVPAGFVTNGADIPRVFWSIYPPNRSDYLPAVVVHDFLCSIEDYKKADRYFREILGELQVSKFDTFILHSGVRFWSIVGRPVAKKIKKCCRGKIGVKSEK